MRTKKSFYLSWLICLVFCTTAFVFLSIGWTQYGVSMFCVLPIILGVATGIIPDRKGAVLGLTIGLITFFILLLASGSEGVICLIMATPIISILVFLGFFIMYLINRKRKKQNTKSYASILPILIFIAASGIEGVIGENAVKETISTSIILPYTPEQVYDQIIHVDTVHAKPGILHQLGLPLPLNCKLTEEKIGGLRICEFEDGQIIETIKAFERGKFLKMDVTDFGLEGRSWLAFDEDIYELEKHEEGTRIKRTTSYYSELKPRIYWSAIEALTIRHEQDLVFRNLILDLNAAE